MALIRRLAGKATRPAGDAVATHARPCPAASPTEPEQGALFPQHPLRAPAGRRRRQHTGQFGAELLITCKQQPSFTLRKSPGEELKITFFSLPFSVETKTTFLAPLFTLEGPCKSPAT